jgi:hypothetical protein
MAIAKELVGLHALATQYTSKCVPVQRSMTVKKVKPMVEHA